MSTNTIEGFAEKLLIEKGMGSVNQETRDELQRDLVERIETLINVEILKRVPEDKLAEFEQLLDSDETISMYNFCADNIPNMESMIAAVLVDVRQAYLAGTL